MLKIFLPIVLTLAVEALSNDNLRNSKLVTFLFSDKIRESVARFNELYLPLAAQYDIEEAQEEVKNN